MAEAAGPVGVRKLTAVSGPAGPRSRNRRGEGGLLRPDILRAAGELLDETGDERAVTLRAVARRVGIAAPSIYAHFPDRQAILLAVVGVAFAELDGELAAAAAASGGDPVERLRGVCAAYLDFARHRPHRYRAMFGGAWNAAAAVDLAAITEDDARQLGREALGVLVSALRDCVAAGRSASTDPDGDAVAVWVALHGLADQRVVSTFVDWPAGIGPALVERVALLTGASDRGRPGRTQMG